MIASGERDLRENPAKGPQAPRLRAFFLAGATGTRYGFLGLCTSMVRCILECSISVHFCSEAYRYPNNNAHGITYHTVNKRFSLCGTPRASG